MENLISDTEVFGVNIIQSPDLAGLEDMFLGEGSGGHLIVSLKDEHTNNNHTFLKKVFQAVNLNISTDSYLLELEVNQKIALGPVLRHKGINSIIVFGLATENLGMHLQLQRYQIASLETQKILLADDLHTIQSSEKLKRALWNNLKEMFPG